MAIATTQAEDSRAAIGTTAVAPVSVGMPVFNGERYLEGALESLLGQTYENFELVISDNGSTDRTAAICKSYAARDERVRYLRQEKNRGASWNFNKVYLEANAPFFRWASYDDLCEPDPPGTVYERPCAGSSRRCALLHEGAFHRRRGSVDPLVPRGPRPAKPEPRVSSEAARAQRRLRKRDVRIDSPRSAHTNTSLGRLPGFRLGSAGRAGAAG